MRFLDPKTDFAFKKIFGSAESKPILIEFLNALVYDSQPIVQDLEILDPYQAPQLQGVKDTFLDVKAQLADGTMVLIEMQVLNPLDFNKRVLYNVAKAYSLQLQRGQGYSRLRPVIGLTITDFVLFPERDRFLSHYQLLDREDGLPYGDDIELVFVELPKFAKSLGDLETLTDLWTFFLQQAGDLEDIPSPLDSSPNLDQAFHIAETVNLSLEEFDLLEKQAFKVEDGRNVVRRALLEGLQQGRTEGEQQRSRDIARSLLGLLPPGTIAEKTGLTVAEVEALAGE